MADAIKNFVIVEVSTGYDASATTVVLESGHGAELPDPAVANYNLVWWNSTDYPNPADDPNVEIPRVTGLSTDTLTIVRPAVGNSYNGEGSENTAKTHNIAGKTYKMMLSATKKVFDDIFNSYQLNAPEGYMLNGKIVPSVASNNLTVAIKTLDGNDATASNPIIIRIGDTVHSITGALSVTKNAGTNWFNAGSAELATKEIDYFVYLGYNATDGVVIGFSRIPYSNIYSWFSATTTNERYCAISTISNAAAGDSYTLVGRFAATLSAGTGYTWSVPTFTTANLIQRPIFTTRILTYTPVGSAGGSMTFTINTVYRATYTLSDAILFVNTAVVGTTGGTGNSDLRISVPFSITNNCFYNGYYKDGTYGVPVSQSNGNLMQTFKGDAVTAWGIGAGKEFYLTGSVDLI